MSQLISELIFGVGNETPIYIGSSDGVSFSIYISEIVAGLVFVIMIWSMFVILGSIFKRFVRT